MSQSEQLERVSKRIGAAVLRFAELNAGQTFYAEELREYVRREVGETAPGSADRILRDLRQKDRLNYLVVSRSKSLYRFVHVDCCCFSEYGYHEESCSNAGVL